MAPDGGSQRMQPQADQSFEQPKLSYGRSGRPRRPTFVTWLAFTLAVLCVGSLVALAIFQPQKADTTLMTVWVASAAGSLLIGLFEATHSRGVALGFSLLAMFIGFGTVIFAF